MKSLRLRTGLIILGSALFMALSSVSFGNNEKSVAELKKQIVDLAQSYQGQGDPDGSKKSSLEVIIQQLLAITPQKTHAEKAANAIGGWHELWGPYSQNKSSKKSGILDPKYIYQIISSKGYYTNIGVYKFSKGQFIGILKGTYTIEPDKISVQFVENGIFHGPVPTGYTLADLPALHEMGEIKVFDFPKALPPVGIRGSLHEIYSDQDLRLTYGVQQGQKGQTLYVLERTPALNY